MALAPERISALSWQSRDALSRAPNDLKILPQAWDSAEALLALDADYVLFGAGEGFSSGPILTKAGKHSSAVEWGEDFTAVKNNFQNIGEAIGAQDQARRQIHDLDDRLRRLETRKATKPKVLYLSRSGGSAGPNTYVDAVIKAAGGQNIIETAGWINPDPEFLIALQPDLILTSYFHDGYDSAHSVPLRHKAVRKFISRHPRLEIPGSLWPCAGPDLIDAAELLHEKLEDLR